MSIQLNRSLRLLLAGCVTIVAAACDSDSNGGAVVPPPPPPPAMASFEVTVTNYGDRAQGGETRVALGFQRGAVEVHLFNEAIIAVPAKRKEHWL